MSHDINHWGVWCWHLAKIRMRGFLAENLKMTKLLMSLSITVTVMLLTIVNIMKSMKLMLLMTEMATKTTIFVMMKKCWVGWWCDFILLSTLRLLISYKGFPRRQVQPHNQSFCNRHGNTLNVHYQLNLQILLRCFPNLLVKRWAKQKSSEFTAFENCDKTTPCPRYEILKM